MESESLRVQLGEACEEEIRKVFNQLSLEDRRKVSDALEAASGQAAEAMTVCIVDMAGNELKQLEVLPTELISQVIARCDLDDNLVGQLMLDEDILIGDVSLQACGVGPDAILSLVISEKPLPPATHEDSDDSSVPSRMSTPITAFGEYDNSPGIELLKGKRASADRIRWVVHALQGSLTGSYESYPEASLLNQKCCQRLMTMADSRSCDKVDFTVRLSEIELVAAIGLTVVRRIFAFFGDRVDWITLRRVEARGQCIKLHLDDPVKTMQIPLNDEAEYEGGKLLYVTAQGLEFPSRPAGSATIHENTIVHGVTPMTRGVRYSLFLSKIPRPLSFGNPHK
eukprot:TRINITY_DN55409_c0_g1_i1.p1 TRINITY_DN55409_c0_g1~~TRINITY_DN55409_c0_g1_i1.p1  ORF type:complete len:340 (+),score=50.32 TRINITY_DN55409_c0_g1_i1:75-1094(+)